MPGARRRGRAHTVSMANIKTWIGLPVEESIRMTKDKDKWRKYVHGVANPPIKSILPVPSNSSSHHAAVFGVTPENDDLLANQPPTPKR